MTTFDPDLLDALEAATHTQATGTVWRQVLAPSSVTRSNLRGGRWNPPNTEALYCSLDAATAAAEIDNLLAAQPVPITRQRYMYSLDIELGRVADLRTQHANERFAYQYDIANSDDCNRIGAACAWLELSGLVVPSMRGDGANLVIYVDNLGVDEHFTVRDEFAYPPGPPVSDIGDRLALGANEETE